MSRANRKLSTGQHNARGCVEVASQSSVRLVGYLENRQHDNWLAIAVPVDKSLGLRNSNDAAFCEACAALVGTRANRNLDCWPGNLPGNAYLPPLPDPPGTGGPQQQSRLPSREFTTYWPPFLWRSACPARLRHWHPPEQCTFVESNPLDFFSAWAEGMPRADGCCVVALDHGMGADLGQ